MAEQIALAARPRAGSGKSEARALRRSGRVPAIVYGRDLDATMLSVDERELWHALHSDAGRNAVLRLTVEGADHLALAREVQRHPVRRDILHVDFVTVSRTERVAMDVPIALVGAEDAPGVREGAALTQELYTLSVEVLALETPDSLALDVSGMEVGDTLRVADIAVPAGVTVTADPDAAVATVVAPTVEAPEPSEAVTGEDRLQAEGATAEDAETLADEAAGDR